MSGTADDASPSGGRAGRAGQWRKGAGPHKTKNAVIFYVRVLTAPLPFKSEDANLILKEGWVPYEEKAKGNVGWGPLQVPVSQPHDPPRIMFRGRIIKSGNGLRPHILIRDPCRLAMSRRTNIALIYKLLQKHTLFISKQSFWGNTPQVGDVMQVSLQRSDFEGPDLQVGHFDEVVDSTQSEIYNFQNLRDCTSLAEKMRTQDPDFSNASFLAAGGGGTATGSSTVPVKPLKAPTQSEIDKTVKFAKKLKDSTYFKDHSVAFLVGLAANAEHESGFNPLAAGDPVSGYSEARQNFHPGLINNAFQPPGKTEKFCSFGYWQLNVCSGGGIRFAEYNGFTTKKVKWKEDPTKTATEQHPYVGREFSVIQNIGTNGSKLWAVLKDENKQMKFVAYRTAQIFGTSTVKSDTAKTPMDWGRDIASEFERCSHCREVGASDGKWASTYNRGDLAQAAYGEYIIKYGK